MGLNLEDMSIYRPSTYAEFRKQYRSLNKKWIEVAKTARLSSDMISRLKIDLPVCPVLYLLIKTHKMQSSTDLNSTDPATFKADA